MKDLDQQAVNAVRCLILDGTRKANSGHPGGAMSSTDMAYTVFSKFLKYDPDNPNWFNRDRFILSAGHESMLLYSLLTLQGFLSIDDLKEFRQLNSKTPGHPEYDPSIGVEATTGPLGQGFSMAVGISAAEEILREKLGGDVIDHYTYALSGDGDMQEPIVMGSAALAGHWGLNKLIVFFDSNDAQIAGKAARADSTDYEKVFAGFGWNVIMIDGNDHRQIYDAVLKAKSQNEKPTIIIGKTKMAMGSAGREGDFTTHGSPLPPEEIAATKEKLGFSKDEFFSLPNDVVQNFRSRNSELKQLVSDWKNNLEEKKNRNAEFASLWNELNGKFDLKQIQLPVFNPGDPVATRAAFGKTLMAFAEKIKFLVGGSADLDPSNATVEFVKNYGDFTKNYRAGRNFAFGVREFPMGAIVNGLALHGLKSFGATFLVFSDYMRHAIRLSAMQKLPTLYVFTHDTFYVGEDGPTHQPIEHISALRAIPNLVVLRPADAIETAASMMVAFEQKERPSALLLTRQKLPVLDLNLKDTINKVRRGAYIIYKSGDAEPEIILIAAGSEVKLAIDAAKMMNKYSVRVVSMPSMELFDEQSEEYKESVLPKKVEYRVAIEAGVNFGWHKYTGLSGWVFGLNEYGRSAPYQDLQKVFGFDAGSLAEKITDRYLKYLSESIF